MKKLIRYIGFCGVLFASLYHAQTTPPNGITTTTQNISEEKPLTPKELVDLNLSTIANDPVLKNASWGFAVYDPKTKKLISSYNETLPLIPASTTKLLTTEAALYLLGEKFRWTTQLEYSGNIDEEGILKGNLYIVGSGDPSIGTGKAGSSRYPEITQSFLSAIQAKGIQKIEGNIIVQTAFFKDNKAPFLPKNIVWKESTHYYLPVGSTTNINPSHERLIIKKTTPFSGEVQKFFYISPYVDKMVYAEKFEGQPTNTKLAEAPLFLANKLKEALIKNKIPCTGKVETKLNDLNPETRNFITAYKSPTLNDIVYDTNQRSDNALAEALLRTLGFMTVGDQTLESGKIAMLNHLKTIRFDEEGLNFSDGSGLSRAHRVTPLAQVKFLASRMNEKYYKSFFDSLPIAGQTGTLKRSFQGNGYGQIYAKTGTLNKVKTLAGYIKTNSGKTLVFSLMLNNYAGSVDQAKNRMEKILQPVLDL